MLLAVVRLVVLTGLAATSCPAAETPSFLGFDADLHTDYLRVFKTISLSIDDPDYELQVGQKLDLFEQAPKHYVALVPLGNGISRLCAIPARLRGGQRTAWVTNEKRVILGMAVETCKGYLTLHVNELLPIMEETDDVYRVICERYGRQVVLDLKRSVKGVVRERLSARRPRAKPSRTVSIADSGVLDAPQIAKLSDTTEPLIRGSIQPTSEVEAPAVSSAPQINREALEDQLRAEIRAEVMAEVQGDQPNADVSAVSAGLDMAGDDSGPDAVTGARPATTESSSTLDAESGVGPGPDKVPTDVAEETLTEDAATPVLVVRGQGEEVRTQLLPHVGGFVVNLVSNSAVTASQIVANVTAPAEMPNTRSAALFSFLSGHALLFQILLGLCIVEGVLIAKMRRNEARTRQVGSSVLSIATFGESVAQNALEDTLSGDYDLSGSLKKFPPEQVIQLLYSSQESGTLSISCQGDSRMHKLYFINGQLIDANAGSRRGMDVLRAVLSTPEGSFSFKREDVSSHSRQFHDDTMSILLTASREADELAHEDAVTS